MTIPTLPVFRGNLIIRGKIKALTGLHIGGSKEKMQIGGVDLVVIRDPITQYPYIPGSSLKGKLRHLLEYISGGVNKPFDGVLGNVSVQEDIVRLFGIGAEVLEMAEDEKKFAEKKGQLKEDDANYSEKIAFFDNVKQLKSVGLPRLTVRDAMPDQATINAWNSLSSDSNFTEYKAENTIDRITSAANPRFIERVAAGSAFDFEIVYTAYGDVDTDSPLSSKKIEDDLSNVVAALRLLEHSALGKAGTRGYGRVKFQMDQPRWVMAKDYLEGGEIFETIEKGMPTENLLSLTQFRATLLDTLKA